MVVRGGGWIATSQSQSQDLFEDDQFPNTDRRSDAPGPCSGKGKRKARPQSDVSYDLEEKEQSQTPSVVVAASQSQQEDTPLAPLPPPESSSQMPVMEPPEERQKKWFQEFAAVNYGECRMILDPRERETRCLRPAAYLWYHNAKGKKVLLPVCLGCARRLSVSLQPATPTVEYAGTRRRQAWDVRAVQAALSKEEEGKSKEGQQAWPQCRGTEGRCRHSAIYGRSESGGEKVIPYACYLHKSPHHVLYSGFATLNGLKSHDSEKKKKLLLLAGQHRRPPISATSRAARILLWRWNCSLKKMAPPSNNRQKMEGTGPVTARLRSGAGSMCLGLGSGRIVPQPCGWIISPT
mmetsp:Transcript_2578/g.4311  ORF Transcript_2578/g.4311 Transcript_2578/m.4311 type:complete len:350 (+) Transcript_2578:41-1090(+)